MSKNETTTTTTEAVKTDPAPKGDAASVNHPGGEASPAAERQGEVKIDKKAKTDVVGEVSAKEDVQAQEENIENAKQDALRNAARENQEQPHEAV